MRRREFIAALQRRGRRGDGLSKPSDHRAARIALVLACCQVPRYPLQRTRAAFVEALSRLGWDEGKNLTVEARAAKGRAERFAEHAAELVTLKVDVAVASNSQAVQALKEKTSTIPIVMLDVSHPVEAGFIAFLATPAGTSPASRLSSTTSTPKCLSSCGRSSPGSSAQA
jgi:putative tryptophan/tyrosine transport system substrate-binding protein